MKRSDNYSVIEIKRIYFYCLLVGIPITFLGLVIFKYNLFEELGATLVASSLFNASKLITFAPSLSPEEAKMKEHLRGDLIQFHAKIAIAGTLMNGFSQQIFDFISFFIGYL